MDNMTGFIVLEALYHIAKGAAIFLAIEAVTGSVAYLPFLDGNRAFVKNPRHLCRSLVFLGTAAAVAWAAAYMGRNAPGAEAYMKWATGSLKRYTAIGNSMLALTYAGMIATYLLYRENNIRTLFRNVAGSYREEFPKDGNRKNDTKNK